MTRTNYGTNWVETELILAAGEDDEETIAELITEMTVGEMRRLSDAAGQLRQALLRAMS